MVAIEEDYGNLADDVLGENGDEDTKEKKDSFDMFGGYDDRSDEDSEEDSGGRYGGFGRNKPSMPREEKLDKNSKTYAPYLSFDFRRMKKKRWPEGCQLLLPETREKVDKEAKDVLKKKLVAESLNSSAKESM